VSGCGCKGGIADLSQLETALLRKYHAQYMPLITFVADAGTGDVRFRVPGVDSRLRIKISVLFVPPGGTAPNIAGGSGATLWLVEAEKDRSGQSGITIPATDVEGTAAAPTTIPANAGLGGYSREFVTSADYIEGTLNAASQAGMGGGQWVLQVDYSPDAVRFTDAEWESLREKMSPRVLGGSVVVGA
jgi:hypothetical protein